MAGYNKVDDKTHTKRTLKERKFIDAYIKNNGNAAQAYRSTHPKYKGENAKVLGCRMLTKVNLDTIELLNEMELTDQQLHKKLKEGLDAKKAMTVMNKIYDVDDFPTRQKYLDMAYKLKGTYPAEKHEDLHKVIVLGAEENKEKTEKEK